MITITLTSVIVDNQDKALRFYTEVLGFVKKTEIDTGNGKWLTVAAKGSNDIELLLEPTGHPASQIYQKALFEDGIPLTAFAADDIQKEYERMNALGVRFRTKPTKMGAVTVAILEDTCGNLIQLVQK